MTVAAFGAGFVLGTRAGREGYEQVAALARRVVDRGVRASTVTGAVDVRERLERYASRLEDFAARDGGSARATTGG